MQKSRDPLKNGTNLSFEKENYIIDGYLGEGANCVVYNAHLVEKESSINVVIKELYPAHAKISRENNELKWDDENTRKEYFERFNETFKKHTKIQNEIIDETAHIISGIKSANNTLYMIVDINNGTTFRQDNTRDLQRELEIMISLTKVINEYHKRGYLHLDIKPENFMVFPKTNDIVKMIDVDTTTEISKLRSGELVHVSYSSGWAAPELERAEIKKIGPASDLYSIVAILFNRIFGEIPDSSDRDPQKKWQVSEEIEKHYPGNNYPSSVGKKLGNIMKKGLNNRPEKRYSSADELVEDLKDVLEIVNRDNYIKSSFALFANLDKIVGRDKSIEEIDSLLKTKKAVFLCGFGGIGKTSVAQKYIEKYKDEYEAIVLHQYLNSLEDFVESVTIVKKERDKKRTENSKESKPPYSQQINLIKELASKKVLFVIDNYDTNEDDLLEEILSIDAKFIFTTRNKEQNIERDEVAFIDVEKLCTEDCITIIENEIGKLSYLDRIAAKELVERYDNHSMLISLIAKYLVKSGKGIQELSREINYTGLESLGEDSDKVRIRKDNKNSNNSVLDHMKQLFRIFDLSDSCIEAIENVYYISEVFRVNKENYKKFTGAKNYNALDELVERGIINKTYPEVKKETDDLFFDLIGAPQQEEQKDEMKSQYSLHPLIRELFLSFRRPAKESKMFKYLKEVLESIDGYHIWVYAVLFHKFIESEQTDEEIDLLLSACKIFYFEPIESETLYDEIYYFYPQNRSSWLLKSIIDNDRNIADKMLEKAVHYVDSGFAYFWNGNQDCEPICLKHDYFDAEIAAAYYRMNINTINRENIEKIIGILIRANKRISKDIKESGIRKKEKLPKLHSMFNSYNEYREYEAATLFPDDSTQNIIDRIPKETLELAEKIKLAEEEESKWEDLVGLITDALDIIMIELSIMNFEALYFDTSIYDLNVEQCKLLCDYDLYMFDDDPYWDENDDMNYESWLSDDLGYFDDDGNYRQINEEDYYASHHNFDVKIPFCFKRNDHAYDRINYEICNGKIGLCLNKDTCDITEQLFVEMYELLVYIREVFTDRIEDYQLNALERAERMIAWKLKYLNGEYWAPYEDYEICNFNTPLLFYKDQQHWAESFFEAFNNKLVKAPQKKGTIYKTFLNVEFLLEQPLCFLKMMKDYDLINKINEEGDRKSSRYYLESYAVLNCNKLLFPELYEEKYRRYDTFDAVLDLYLTNDFLSDYVKQEFKVFSYTEINTLCNQIIIRFRNGKQDTLARDLETLLCGPNSRFAEEFTEISEKLKKFGYNTEAVFVEDTISRLQK